MSAADNTQTEFEAEAPRRPFTDFDWAMPDNITIYRYCLLRAFPTTGIV